MIRNAPFEVPLSPTPSRDQSTTFDKLNNLNELKHPSCSSPLKECVAKPPDDCFILMNAEGTKYVSEQSLNRKPGIGESFERFKNNISSTLAKLGKHFSDEAIYNIGMGCLCGAVCSFYVGQPAIGFTLGTVGWGLKKYWDHKKGYD